MADPANRLLLGFYGDDFTGSTDALEVLTRAGINTALFIDLPTAEDLASFPNLQAVGIAGASRSLPPDKMLDELLAPLGALKLLNPRHVHYKVCSTFDSSPSVGSIGKAIEIGRFIFRSGWTPLVVGAPALGRYTAFGNHFARFGIGSSGQIHRLDRHPSMSKHPVTPSEEADLRLHLGKQTDLSIALFDLLDLERDPAARETRLESIIAESSVSPIVLFDLLYEEHLLKIGALLEKHARAQSPLFSVGSSGVEMALAALWTAEKRVAAKGSFPKPEPATPLLVLSGSCSPVTERQIQHALAAGFADVALDTAALAGDPVDPVPVEKAAAQVAAELRAGRHTILHTSLGPNDPRLNIRPVHNYSTSNLYGTALGDAARLVLESVPLARVVIAGGDTSSYAAQAMGIRNLSMIAPLTPGAPICIAQAPGSPADKVQLLFKGGQVGGDSYFLQAAKGTL